MKIILGAMLPISQEFARPVVIDINLPVIPRLDETIVLSEETANRLMDTSLEKSLFSKEEIQENKKAWEKLIKDTDGDILHWVVDRVKHNEKHHEVFVICVPEAIELLKLEKDIEKDIINKKQDANKKVKHSKPKLS